MSSMKIVPMKNRSLIKSETAFHLLGTRILLPGNYGGLGRRYYDQLGQDLDKIIQVRKLKLTKLRRLNCR